MVRKNMIKPVKLMLVYFSLVILWNVIGVYRLSIGLPALGATASLTVVYISLAMGFALWFTQAHLHFMQYIIPILTLLLTVVAIYGAFTKDPSLWPSNDFRYLGIILNGYGLLVSMIFLRALRR